MSPVSRICRGDAVASQPTSSAPGNGWRCAQIFVSSSRGTAAALRAAPQVCTLRRDLRVGCTRRLQRQGRRPWLWLRSSFCLSEYSWKRWLRQSKLCWYSTDSSLSLLPFTAISPQAVLVVPNARHRRCPSLAVERILANCGDVGGRRLVYSSAVDTRVMTSIPHMIRRFVEAEISDPLGNIVRTLKSAFRPFIMSTVHVRYHKPPLTASAISMMMRILESCGSVARATANEYSRGPQWGLVLGCMRHATQFELYSAYKLQACTMTWAQ